MLLLYIPKGCRKNTCVSYTKEIHSFALMPVTFRDFSQQAETEQPPWRDFMKMLKTLNGKSNEVI